MSVPAVPQLSHATKLALIKSFASHRDENAAPPDEAPSQQPPVKSYEVRIRAGLGDTTFVVGHDRLGAPMIELRVRRKHLTPSMVRRMERWCRDHDEPDLHLV